MRCWPLFWLLMEVFFRCEAVSCRLLTTTSFYVNFSTAESFQCLAVLSLIVIVTVIGSTSDSFKFDIGSLITIVRFPKKK